MDPFIAERHHVAETNLCLKQLMYVETHDFIWLFLKTVTAGKLPMVSFPCVLVCSHRYIPVFT